jgi:DMSO/TMAO reductase YedYZ molybdopterin-dependent catalytic subunit
VSEFDRRRFLLASVVGSTVPLAERSPLAIAESTPPPPRFSGLIPRVGDPENLEMPFADLEGFLVPTERFYVRNHFPVPNLDLAAWRLKVEGEVARPLDLTFDELAKLPTSTRPILLECAGNGRVFLTPREDGVAWGLGAVGCAEWTGVALADILDRAGVAKTATSVHLEGADSGTVAAPVKSPGPVAFGRSLPLAKARKDVLLATKMNGKDLTPAHGWPLRAVVPGWYAMASVKWLVRIVVSAKPIAGYFETFDYTIYERPHGIPTPVPITELEVKSSIARPAAREVVPAGSDYRVFGAAWTGESEIARVEVSTDGGATWNEAQLLDEAQRHAWRRWEYAWKVPAKAGRAVVLARATDARGRTQPMKRTPDLRSYMVHHVLPVEVEIRSR